MDETSAVFPTPCVGVPSDSIAPPFKKRTPRWLNLRAYFRNVCVELPYFKALSVDGVTYQMLTVIARTPWAMKGIIGALSDSFALGGYHKRYYMLFACFWGSAALALLGFIPTFVMQDILWLAPILFFVVHYQTATLDLLCEGKYTEIMADNPESRSNIVTFVWGCITLGSLSASCLVGPISDYAGPRVIFWLMLPLALHVILPLALGFLPEERLSSSLSNRFLKDKIADKANYFMVAIATAIGALFLAFLSLFAPPLWQFVYSIVSSVVLVLFVYKAMPRRLANCNLYMYIQECLYVSLAGAIDFWYTANPVTCVPNGPGFNYTYYQTYSQLVGHTASIFGLWLFQVCMSSWKFRYVYWTTTVLRVAASFFDLVIVKRWNITYLGIGDRAMYLIGDAIILPVCTMLNFMPGVILTARLCPKSMESTVYAILAGFANFGGNTARAFGVYLQQRAGVKTQEPDCDFSSLPMLIVLCHGLLPCLSIPITFVLLPATRMNEPLDGDDVRDNERDIEETKPSLMLKLAESSNKTSPLYELQRCSESTSQDDDSDDVQRNRTLPRNTNRQDDLLSFVRREPKGDSDDTMTGILSDDEKQDSAFAMRPLNTNGSVSDVLTLLTAASHTCDTQPPVQQTRARDSTRMRDDGLSSLQLTAAARWNGEAACNLVTDVDTPSTMRSVDPPAPLSVTDAAPLPWGSPSGYQRVETTGTPRASSLR